MSLIIWKEAKGGGQKKKEKAPVVVGDKEKKMDGSTEVVIEES
jgi:hypothetical protein